MTQYLLSVHHDVDELEAAYDPDADFSEVYAAVDAFNEKVKAAGAWVFGGGLMPVETATTVDASGAEAMVVDGPYAEAKEYLGGFWIIEAADLDEALRWATEGSRACRGKVEVRPFQAE